MLIPQVSVPTSDDDASLGLLLSTLTALMKAVKSNSANPIQHLLRERLLDKTDRKNLNRILFALTTGLSRKKEGGLKKNNRKKVLLDSVDSEVLATEQTEFLDEVVIKILNRDFPDGVLYLLAVLLRNYSQQEYSSFNIDLKSKTHQGSVTIE